MVALFFIIFILPAIAGIVLLIAIVKGMGVKNPKRYFMILGCITGGVAFLFSLFFVDYQSAIVNLFASRKVPAEYRGYRHLSDTVTADYSVRELEGRSLYEIYTDSTTGYLIVVTRDEGLDCNEFYYRIDSSGALSCMDDREEMYHRGRYLIGARAWCDWFDTGDTTRKAYTPMEGVFGRESLRPLYQAADYAEFFRDSICVLHKGEIWYSCRLDFQPDYYMGTNEYDFKDDYSMSHLTPRHVDVVSSRYERDWVAEKFLNFDAFPAELGAGLFRFDYFGKEEYYSGFSSLFSGMGSPTGGSNHFAKWDGSGYFRLRIGGRYIPFVWPMAHNIEFDNTYEATLSVYAFEKLAILAGSAGVYLITIGPDVSGGDRK